jgi:hypothetical protein
MNNINKIEIILEIIRARFLKFNINKTKRGSYYEILLAKLKYA